MALQAKYLENLKNERTFIDLYTDHFEESIYGWIADFNDEFLLLEKFSDLGRADGISVLKLVDITRVKWGGNDIENTCKIALKQPRLKNIGKISINTQEEILKSIQKEFGYVTIYVQNIDSEICIIGEVEDLDSETIIIHEFGTMATLDRKRIMFSLQEITRVDVGGEYEKNLVQLFKKIN